MIKDGVTTSVFLPLALVRRARLRAVRDGYRSLSAWLRHVIEEALRG